jgi:hypothetical protein
MAEIVVHPDDTFSPAPGVVVREVGEELVLLDLGRNFYFGLDPVGARMWAVLTAGHSFAQAFELLAREFEVEPERLRADLEGLVVELAAHSLIVVAPE